MIKKLVASEQTCLSPDKQKKKKKKWENEEKKGETEKHDWGERERRKVIKGCQRLTRAAGACGCG